MQGENSARLTIYVIDPSAFRAHKRNAMLTAEYIREELIRQLDDGRVKAATVAKMLGIAPPRVTEMRRKQRKVQDREMVPLANLLKMLDTPESGKLHGVVAVPILGRAAVGVWVERCGVAPAAFADFDMLSDTQHVDKLFAIVTDGDAMSAQFPSGTTIICREFSGDEPPAVGSYIIIARQRGDLVEHTCKLVQRAPGGELVLLNESSNPRYADAIAFDDDVQILGKVIRAYRSYE